MKAFDYIPLYTYQDYLLWEGDWELINGHPHAMSPSIRKHQFICGMLGAQLHELLGKKQVENCSFYYKLDWIVNENTVVRPDVMIVCGEFKDDFLRFPPTLIVEVLSASTSMKDKNIKYKLYEEQKVKYYILANPDTQTCDIFELQNGIYVAVNEAKKFVLQDDCKMEFDISTFVAKLNIN